MGRHLTAERPDLAALRDGTMVLVRIATLADTDAVAELFRSASPQSLRYRFCAAVARISPSVIQDLVTVDYTDRAAVVALVATEAGERLIGIANYARTGEETAEVAFMVDDRFHRRGVGTLLLGHLSTIANHHGITKLTAEVLDENLPMLRLFAECGYELSRSYDGGLVTVEVGTGAA